MRTLVVRCPDWAVVAAGVAPTEPVVVVHANRVVAATPAARAEGVAVGQRRREAQGRCPEVVVIERDEGRQARRFEPVVRALEAFTPRVELSRPGLVAFPTRGPSRYFGGDAALAGQARAVVEAELAPQGWPGHAGVGVADGRFAAHRAAQAGAAQAQAAQAQGATARGAGATAVGAAGVVVVPAGESAAFLAPWPVATLGRPELAEVLRRLGLRTLGDLSALAPADVVARFGADGQVAYRLASGLDEHPPATTVPLPELAVAAAIDPPAERVDQVAFVGKTLADELHARLAERGLACTRVLVRAATDHDEGHERLWRHEGALAPAAVADRVRWQLDGWLNGPPAARPTAGVSRLELVPDEVVPARGRQLGFWGGETATAERAARAVARIEGLLGPDAVVVPEWRGGRSPAERVATVAAGSVDLTVPRQAVPPDAREAPWPGQLPAPSPASVLPEPCPAEVVDAHGRPVTVSGRGLISSPPARLSVAGAAWEPIGAWAGPWPVEERWWDRATGRRRARFQLVAGARAYLLAIEGGRWWVEAVYR